MRTLSQTETTVRVAWPWLATSALALAFVLAACGGGSDGVATFGFAVDGATIALWRLDEGAGQTALDAGPSRMHLQLGNTSAGDPADPAWVATGRVGSCLAFTSADGDHASNAEPISFQTNELSVELWFRTTRERGSLFEAGREVCGLLWGGAVFSFVVSDGTLLHSAQISSLADLAVMTDGNWHYLAATYDGQAMRIYLDGEEKASLVTSATPPVVTAIHVGGHPSGGGSDAEIDEVRLSSRARSAAEIQAHWGASSP